MTDKFLGFEARLHQLGLSMGAIDDSEAVGDGSVIAVMKRVRTLLGGSGSIESITYPVGVYSSQVLDVSEETWSVNASYSYAPGLPNVAAEITLPSPGAGVSWVLAALYWSYNEDPTNGEITVHDGGTQIHKLYVTSGGPGFLPFVPPMKFTANTYVVIGISAAGVSTYGSVGLQARTE